MNAIERLRGHNCRAFDYSLPVLPFSSGRFLQVGGPTPLPCKKCAALAAVDALYQAAKEIDTLRNLQNDEITVPVVFGALGPVAAAVRRIEGEPPVPRVNKPPAAERRGI